MSQYGVFEGRWAPITSETEEALPTYGPAVSLGAVSKVTDALNFASLKAEGDDRVQDSLDDFISGTVDLEYNAGVPNEALAAVHGAELGEDGEVAYGVDDEPPYGGYVFMRRMILGSKKYFQGIFYPKLKAVPQGKDHNGKKVSGTTLTGDKIHMNLEAPMYGKYMYISPELATLAEARAWLEAKLPMQAVAAASEPAAQEQTTA